MEFKNSGKGLRDDFIVQSTGCSSDDAVSVPSTHNYCSSRSGESDALFWLQWVLHSHHALINIEAKQTPVYIESK